MNKMNYRELDENEKYSLHDIILDVFNSKNIDCIKEENTEYVPQNIVSQIYNKLPLELLEEGCVWGFNDTLVRTKVFLHLKDNLPNISF